MEPNQQFSPQGQMSGGMQGPSQSMEMPQLGGQLGQQPVAVPEKKKKGIVVGIIGVVLVVWRRLLWG